MRHGLQNFEHIIRRTFNHFGLDLHRHRPEESGIGRLNRMLEQFGIDVVFDVGANVGQFAKALREVGYKKNIISFEPLSQAHQELVRASRNDEQWIAAPRTAIGDRNGEITIHVAGNTVSSSILDMLDAHRAAAPLSAYVSDEMAPIHTLDSLAPEYLHSDSIPFLKIDTQGYEQYVLDGARECLKAIKGVHLELSLVPLYEGQQLFPEFMEYFTARGFSLWSIEPGFSHTQTGRMLQVDAVFFRH
jgi:FkbM family methyltransferase